MPAPTPNAPQQPVLGEPVQQNSTQPQVQTPTPATTAAPFPFPPLGLPLPDPLSSAFFARAAAAIQGLAAAQTLAGNASIPLPAPNLAANLFQQQAASSSEDKAGDAARTEAPAAQNPASTPISGQPATANPLPVSPEEAARMLLAPLTNNPAAAANSLLMLSNAAAANVPKPTESTPPPPPSSATAVAQLAALYPQIAAAAAALDPFSAVMARAHLALAGAAGFPPFPYPFPPQALHEAMTAAASAASDSAKQNDSNGQGPSSSSGAGSQSEQEENMSPGKDGKFTCDICDRSFSRYVSYDEPCPATLVLMQLLAQDVQSKKSHQNSSEPSPVSMHCLRFALH